MKLSITAEVHLIANYPERSKALENIFKEDYFGEIPASTAQKQLCVNHPPQEFQDENFGRDLKRLE